MRSLFLIVVALIGWGAIPVASAQEVYKEYQETVSARVLEVVEQYERAITGTGASTTVQTLRIEILEGEKTGEVVRLDNDALVLKPKDTIFVNRYVDITGSEYYLFKDVERRGPLFLIIGIFMALVVGLSGKQGVRALFSLALSIGAVVFALIPAIKAGYNPAGASLVIAAIILAVSLFVTHGFKPKVIITFIGTFSAVAVTCAIAYIWVDLMRFTGYGSDASVYLNFATGGTIDLTGLLLGGIIIGVLGILDDISITQASVVQALKGANPALGFKALYGSALAVGRDHLGSVVNTLALAYVGASLPLLLLLSYTEGSVGFLINQEVIASEIARIVIGSIGLILAVPFTTAMAAWYFKDRVVAESEHDDHNHHHHH